MSENLKKKGEKRSFQVKKGKKRSGVKKKEKKRKKGEKRNSGHPAFYVTTMTIPLTSSHSDTKQVTVSVDTGTTSILITT